MYIKLYPLDLLGHEIIGESEQYKWFILEYEFYNEHIIYHQAQVFYTMLDGSAYFHNLN